jgi:hypothetical protein
MKSICCAALIAGTLAVVAPAAVADPPTPANCTFSKGVTVCSTTMSSSSVVPAGSDQLGCPLVMWETTTLTTYTAHRGAPDSQGPGVAAPPATTTVTDGAPFEVISGCA